jgi:hypothetical protein
MKNLFDDNLFDDNLFDDNLFDDNLFDDNLFMILLCRRQNKKMICCLDKDFVLISNILYFIKHNLFYF